MKRQPVRAWLATALILACLTIWSENARAGSILGDLLSGNGGGDPFNKNNSLGVVIKTPQYRPPSPTNSTFDDPPTYSFKVTPLGDVYRSQDGGPFQKLSQKATKGEYPSGVTYWKFMNYTVTAAPQEWDHAKINQLQQQAVAQQQHQQELQKRAQARQQILAIEQTIDNTPFDQVVGEVRTLPDVSLVEAKVRVGILIQVIKSENLADTTGFERLALALNDEVGRRKAFAQQQANQQQGNQPQFPQNQPQFPQTQPLFPQNQPQFPQNQPSPANLQFAANLGIQYVPVQQNDGTFGARLTRPPEANSPAARLGLEPGDIVFELDGQKFTRPEDVLGHRFQTEIGFIDVRSGDTKTYNIYIP